MRREREKKEGGKKLSMFSVSEETQTTSPPQIFLILDYKKAMGLVEY